MPITSRPMTVWILSQTKRFCGQRIPESSSRMVDPTENKEE